MSTMNSAGSQAATQILAEADQEEEFKPPTYSTKGRMIVEVSEPDGPCRWTYEVLDYDGDSSVFWIQEGEGFDYWLDDNAEFPGPGVYLIEDISGVYYRGDGWTTDDDVYWTFSDPVATKLRALP